MKGKKYIAIQKFAYHTVHSSKKSRLFQLF